MSSGDERRPGRIPVSRSFQHRFRDYNGLDELGFDRWVFHPAMLFGSHYKWWGNQGKRNRPHEGLDLCYYRTKTGQILYFDEKIVVPVIFNGQVVRVIGDFLGESVFVSHGSFGNEGSQLYTIYGHLRPRRSIRPGETLGEHDIIGAIADPAVNGSTMPPHLHISMALIPDIRSSQELDWQIIGDLTDIILVDPLRVIELPYSVEAAL